MSARRVLANLALTGTVVLIVGAGLRDVPGVATLSRLARPLIGAVGLEQDWNVFAPDPRREGQWIEAVVTWSDGSRTRWTIPSRGRLVGAYSDYRWRKWAEYAASDRAGVRLWRPATRYVVQRLTARRSATPTELRLIRRVRSIPPPGTVASPRDSEVELYRASLASRTP